MNDGIQHLGMMAECLLGLRAYGARCQTQREGCPLRSQDLVLVGRERSEQALQGWALVPAAAPWICRADLEVLVGTDALAHVPSCAHGFSARGDGRQGGEVAIGHPYRSILA